MPIYEYYCGICDIRFEEKMSIHDDSSKAYCPQCKGSVGKVPSLSSFHLIGTGWYKDGYSSAPSSNKNK